MKDVIVTIMLFVLALSGVSSAQPGGPFAAGGDTYLLLHLDGDFSDSGLNVLKDTLQDSRS